MQKGVSDYLQSPSTIAVIGLGKIGLPLAIQYTRHGQRVIGCDINPHVVECINSGRSHIQEEPELATDVPRMVEAGLLSATGDITEAVRQAHVIIIIVPVFIDAQHQVDFAQIDAATAAVGAGLHSGSLIIYETTLPVGTTAKRLSHILENASGLQAGTDFYLAYSPERVSSGSIFRDLQNYPKVVGGLNTKSTMHAVTFYRSVLDADIITMASTDEAEFVKLIETTYRDVNIALANEYACYADTHGLDVTMAIAAANTQPYSHIHTPGVGVGGHCIPVYPYFLFANPSDTHLDHQMLVLPHHARQINDAMAEYAIQRIEAMIGSLSQRSVLILGVTYRGNVRETAFTSAKLLQDALVQRHATVYVDDPLFSQSELSALGYAALPPETEGEITAIILQSNHALYQTFDFRRFVCCRVVFDGRHALDRAVIETSHMHYMTIGDGQHIQNKN